MIDKNIHDHPTDFLGSVIDYKDIQEGMRTGDYSKAEGHLLPSIALAVGTGGVGGAGAKAGETGGLAEAGAAAEGGTGLAVSNGESGGVGAMETLRTLSPQEDLNALVENMH